MAGAGSAEQGTAPAGTGALARLEELGAERVALWTIDRCHPDPQSLRRHAAGQRFERREGDYYPGLRAPVPQSYREWIVALLEPVLGARGPASLSLLDCTFALACDDPAKLAPIQLIPHFDSLEGDLFAAVHYLCAPPFAGTAFFRHRRTGFERIDATRIARFQQGLTADAREYGLPHERYHGEASAAFEQIGLAPLECNRIVAYPANCLHSGLLGAAALSAEPGSGRLTITTLLRRLPDARQG